MPYHVAKDDSCPSSRPWAVIKGHSGTDGEVMGCVVGDTEVWGPRATRSTTRWYEGEIIEITTVGQQFLTVTPNHPILTDKGWIAAGLLDEGCQVITGSPIEPEKLTAPDDYQIPSRIEDVAAALGERSSVVTTTVKVTAVDFHGDGGGSEVCTVLTDCLIDDGIDTESVQVGANSGFIGGIERVSFALSSLRRFAQILKRSFVSGFALLGSRVFLFAFLRRHLGYGQRMRFAAGSGVDIISLERSDDSRIVHAVSGSDFGRGLSRQVSVDEGFVRRHVSSEVFGRSAVPERHAILVQATLDGCGGNTIALSECLGTFAGTVGVDKVLSARRIPFSGHVYNLTTVAGWYAADGLIVSNCHETESSAQDQMSALYVHADDEGRSAGQLQAFYGSTTNPSRWAVVTLPWGFAPERDYAGLSYLGEPIELLRQLYRYRLSLAREKALDYVAGVLASELHIDRAELHALVTDPDVNRMMLPTAGWALFAQACLFGIGSAEWQEVDA